MCATALHAARHASLYLAPSSETACARQPRRSEYNTPRRPRRARTCPPSSLTVTTEKPERSNSLPARLQSCVFCCAPRVTHARTLAPPPHSSVAWWALPHSTGAARYPHHRAATQAYTIHGRERRERRTGEKERESERARGRTGFRRKETTFRRTIVVTDHSWRADRRSVLLLLRRAVLLLLAPPHIHRVAAVFDTHRLRRQPAVGGCLHELLFARVRAERATELTVTDCAAASGVFSADSWLVV